MMEFNKRIPEKVLFFFPPYRKLASEEGESLVLSAPAIPLGPASVAMYLRHRLGLIASVYCSPDYSAETLEKVIRDYSPDVIGISCWSYNRFACLALAELAKKVDPQVVIVFGGIHATFLDWQILHHYPCVDYVIRGEGEETLKQLINVLAGRDEIESVRGLSFRKDGKMFRTANRCWMRSLDDLPTIDYQQVRLAGKQDETSKEELYLHNALPVETSRGCPFNCLFCSGVGYMGQGVARRSVDKVMEQVAMVNKVAAAGIYFHDMNFTLDRRYAECLCLRLISENISIPWVCSTRIDLVDREILELLYRAGCRMIFYGVDSLSQKMLTQVRRRYTPEQAVKNANMTIAAGIQAEVNLIVGFPHETQRDRVEMLRNMQRLHSSVQVHVNGLMLFPGAEIYDQAKQEGFDEDYWLSEHDDLYPYYTETLSTKEMQLWIKRLQQYSHYKSTLKGALKRGSPKEVGI